MNEQQLTIDLSLILLLHLHVNVQIIDIHTKIDNHSLTS